MQRFTSQNVVTIEPTLTNGVSTPGFATSGNIAAAIPPTTIDQNWTNLTTDEIYHAANGTYPGALTGLTPSGTVNNQLYSVISSRGKTTVTGTVNLYVATTGSDSANTGLTSDSPFATLQHAYTYAANTYALNGNTCQINVSAGTYTTGVICNNPSLSGYIAFVGNNTSPAGWTSTTQVLVNVSNGNAFYVAGGNQNISVSGFAVATTGAASNTSAIGYGVVSGQGAIINLANISFGTCGTSQVIASSYGTVGFAYGSTFYFTGTSPYGLVASVGQISCVGTTFHFASSTYTIAFTAAIYGAAIIACWSMTFSGSFTGQRYNASWAGSINTNSNNTSYFPGSVAGSANSGGFIGYYY